MDTKPSDIRQLILQVSMLGAITVVSCSCCKFLDFSQILCDPERILTGQWWICRILLEGEKDGLLMLPSDKALLDEPKTRALVELYAKVPLFPILNFDNDFDSCKHKLNKTQIYNQNTHIQIVWPVC